MTHHDAMQMQDRLVRATRALRYETAAQRVLLTARGLLDALEPRYNPNWSSQPRVATGPEAGQWTDGSTDRRPATPTLVAAKTKDFDYACRVLKVDPKEATIALHAAKLTLRLRRENCIFDTVTGDIIFNGEIIGNLGD